MVSLDNSYEINSEFLKWIHLTMVIKKTMFHGYKGVTNPNHDATAKYHSQFKKV